jgi:hypothetical protein
MNPKRVKTEILSRPSGSRFRQIRVRARAASTAALLALLAFAPRLLLAQPPGPGGSPSPTNSPGSSASGTAPGTGSTPGSASLPATILSYESQERIGQAIARHAKSSIAKAGSAGSKERPPPSKAGAPARVYLTTGLLNGAGSLFAYKAVSYQVDALVSTYEATIPTGVLQGSKPRIPASPDGGRAQLAMMLGVTPTSAQDLTGAISQLLGLARTTTTLNGGQVSQNDLGVLPAVAEFLRKDSTANIEVVYADFFANPDYMKKDSSIVAKFGHAAALRGLAKSAIGLAVSKPGDEILKGYDLASLTNRLHSLNATYDSLLTNYFNSSSLADLLTADYYYANIYGATNSFLLFVKVIYAGGIDRVKSNPVIDIFTGGARYSYAGGAVASYLLVDNTGNLASEKTFRDLRGYKKIKGNAFLSPLPVLGSNLGE